MRVDAETAAKCLALAVKVNGRVPEPVLPVFASEAEFQAEVERIAKERGWRAYHTRDSRKSAKGFLDLVLVRERVVWAELKAEDGRPTADQLNWIDDLRAAGEEVYVWKPSDMAEVLSVLGERRRTWRDWLLAMAERITLQSGLLSQAAERRR